MDLDYNEFQKFVKDFKKMVNDYDKFTTDFLTKQGMRCLADTKRNTPVDEGTLREKWEIGKVQKNGNEKFIEIFNNLEYASWVEDGYHQRKRFVPIRVLTGTKKRNALADYIKQKYGEKAAGIMLKDKQIKGRHMARNALNKAQSRIAKQFEQELIKWFQQRGVG